MRLGTKPRIEPTATRCTATVKLPQRNRRAATARRRYSPAAYHRQHRRAAPRHVIVRRDRRINRIAMADAGAGASWEEQKAKWGARGARGMRTCAPGRECLADGRTGRQALEDVGGNEAPEDAFVRGLAEARAEKERRRASRGGEGSRARASGAASAPAPAAPPRARPARARPAARRGGTQAAAPAPQRR